MRRWAQEGLWRINGQKLVCGAALKNAAVPAVVFTMCVLTDNRACVCVIVCVRVCLSACLRRFPDAWRLAADSAC